MMNKMFLNLIFVEKLLDDNGFTQVPAMTSILDSTHGFEL